MDFSFVFRKIILIRYIFEIKIILNVNNFYFKVIWKKIGFFGF